MRASFLFLLSFCLGCAPKVHRSFEANRYISGFSTYATNSSHNLYFRSPGDIDYARECGELDSILHGVPVNKVLFYGKSNLKPIYELYVLLNPKMKRVDLTAFTHVLDTSLQGKHLVFLGRDLQDPFPGSDFEGISKSIVRGKNLLRDLAPLNDVLERQARSPKYLEAYTDIANYPVSHPNDRGLQLQMELTYLSMLGNNVRFHTRLMEWEKQFPLDTSLKGKIREHGVFGKPDVIDILLNNTEDKKLVMLSENHFYPWHRILIKELLPGLKTRGFGYLALETLAVDSALNKGIGPGLSAGFYTREQHFYRLLRTAHDLGFQFVAYDQIRGTPDREVAQAKNLYEKTFAKDPDARVLVLAGLDHIYERGGGNTVRTRMAQHFKSRYGIDPLTISQTDLAVYRNALDSDLALVASDSLESKRYQRVDLQVINNLHWGYPPGDFSYTNTWNKPLQVALYNATGWLSDFGYLGDIPEFSHLLLPGQTFSVQLPDGPYQLLLFDSAGAVVRNQAVSDMNTD